MKTAKCYGRKKTVVLERSFVRNFFDGDKSSDFRADSFKNGHIYSRLDFSEEEEGNSACNVSRSPILFGSSDEENSPPQNCRKVTDQDSLGSFKKKSCRVRKEYPIKKKNCRKKPKQIWRGLTEVFDCNQPRWSEFFNHSFTVEQQTMKNKAFDSDYDKSYKNISQTQNLPTVNDHSVDISNISCILKEKKEVNKRHASFIQEAQRAKKRNSSMHNVCKNKKKSVLNPENIFISDTLNSSGDLFICNSDLIKKKRKKNNICFQGTNQTKQKFKENINLNSVKSLEQKINHCVKSSNIPLNFAESFNTSEDLFPAISSVEEDVSSEVSPYKMAMCNQETVPIYLHPSLNRTDTPKSSEQMKLSSFSAIHNLSNAVANLSVANKISTFQHSNSKTSEQIIDDKQLNESSVINSTNNMSKSYKRLKSNLMPGNHNSSNAVIKDEKTNEYDVVNSIKNSSPPKISQDDAKFTSLLCLDFHPPLSFSNSEGKEYDIQDKSLNDPSANMYTKIIYDSLNNSCRGLKSAISPDLMKIFQKENSTECREGRKILTSTPAIKDKSSAYSLLHCGSVSSLSLKKMAADFASVSREENFHYSNEILFIDDKVNFVHANCSSISTSSKKSLGKKSYSAPKREKPSKESVLPIQKSNYSNESTKTKLLQLCNQDCVLSFSAVYDWSNSKIKKIGEGTYGEVFMMTKKRISCVLKVIPVSECTDDDYQGLQNVLSEVKISKCLSDLRTNKNNQTKNFIKLNRVSLVCGAYPSVLIDAWDSFSAAKSTYNDRPDIFGDEQLFVILELEYGGKDMTCFVLRNATEAESVLKQITVSLAIAEEEFSFEHRDLHLGNILIQRCQRRNASYILRGQNISFKCNNLHVTIIDFTLSRLYENGYIYYNDLAEDVSLFNQSGDYQFEIYRNMKDQLENQWNECLLYSNVLWLKFLCVKMEEYEYNRPSSAAHKKGLKRIDVFKEKLTHCSCALDCIGSCSISSIQFESNLERHQQSSKNSILISRTSFQKSKLSICK